MRCRKTGPLLAAALVITAAWPGAHAAETTPQRRANPPDLCGTWRLDPSRSDVSPFAGPGGPRSGTRSPADSGDAPPAPPRGGPTPGSPPAEPPGWPDGLPPGGPPGGMRMRLPDLFRIEMHAGVLRFADSTGAVLQEIDPAATMQPAEPGENLHPAKEPGELPAAASRGAPPVATLPGHWQDEQLVVESSGGRGRKMTRAYTLVDGGKSLVIQTRIDMGGDRSPRESKRCYRKVGG